MKRANDVKIVDIGSVVGDADHDEVCTTLLQNCAFFKGHRKLTADGGAVCLLGEIDDGSGVLLSSAKFHSDIAMADDLVTTLGYIAKHARCITDCVHVPRVLSVGSCESAKLKKIGLEISKTVIAEYKTTNFSLHCVAQSYIPGDTLSRMFNDTDPSRYLPLGSKALGVIDWEHTTHPGAAENENAFPLSAFDNRSKRDWSIFELSAMRKAGYTNDKRFDPRAYVWTRVLYDLLVHVSERDYAITDVAEAILLTDARSVKAFYCPLEAPMIADDTAIHLAIDALERAAREPSTPDITSSDGVSDCEDLEPPLKRCRRSNAETISLRGVVAAVLRHIAAFATACRQANVYHFDAKLANIIVLSH